MNKYKFTKSGRSYATGQTWVAGQTVPDSFSIGLVETMLKDGTIVECKPAVKEPVPEKQKEVVPEKSKEAPVEQKAVKEPKESAPEKVPDEDSND